DVLQRSAMPDVPASFACPRCRTPVTAGATRCPVCALTGASVENAANAVTQPQVRTLLAFGCLGLLLAFGLLVGPRALPVKRAEDVRRQAQNDEMKRVIEEDARRYRSEQARQGRRVA